jgi:hypothetical protein
MTFEISMPDTRRKRLDPKRVHHALFGLWYEEDIYDRLCPALPRALRRFWHIPAAMKARGLIFVHVPRVAGASICQSLYGSCSIRHHSIRYFQAIAPDFVASTPSFALLRDPFDRFVSSYAFVRNGGAAHSRLSDVFVRQTAGIASLDDYLSFLEGRGPLELDFVMRPQSWFVCDLVTGEPLVKSLFIYGENEAALTHYLASHGVGPLPWINRSDRSALSCSLRQRRRIERIYADDFALLDRVRGLRIESARVAAMPDMLQTTRIAAE